MTDSINNRVDDEAKFKRLATRRTNCALKYIRLIGNLSNKSNYVYDPKDVKKLFSTLKDSIQETEEMFAKSKPAKFVLED